MKNTITWSQIFSIWIIYFVATILMAIPVILVAAIVGGAAGLFGYLFGVSTPHLVSLGSAIGFLTYLGGTIIALKYALSKTYKGFKLVVLPA
ncbi:MAG: hypothetical protein WCH44_10015 [Betaproteobacteria bacterium]